MMDKGFGQILIEFFFFLKFFPGPLTAHSCSFCDIFRLIIIGGTVMFAWCYCLMTLWKLMIYSVIKCSNFNFIFFFKLPHQNRKAAHFHLLFQYKRVLTILFLMFLHKSLGITNKVLSQRLCQKKKEFCPKEFCAAWNVFILPTDGTPLLAFFYL